MSIIQNRTIEITVVIQTTHACGQIHKQTLDVQECTYNLTQDIPASRLVRPALFPIPEQIPMKIDFAGIGSRLAVEGIELKDGLLVCVKCGKP